MGDDGGTGFPAALACVAVFESGLIVRKLEFHPAPDRFRRVLAFFDQQKIAQVAVTMRTRAMSCELRGAFDFQNAVQIPATESLDMSFAAFRVVLTSLFAFSRL